MDPKWNWGHNWEEKKKKKKKEAKFQVCLPLQCNRQQHGFINTQWEYWRLTAMVRATDSNLHKRQSDKESMKDVMDFMYFKLFDFCQTLYVKRMSDGERFVAPCRNRGDGPS